MIGIGKLANKIKRFFSRRQLVVATCNCCQSLDTSPVEDERGQEFIDAVHRGDRRTAERLVREMLTEV